MQDSKKTFGIALGSGAARGLAHIGILKSLSSRGINIDVISGTSMGSLVGACYAKAGNIKELEDIALKIDWRQMIRLADPKLWMLTRGIIHGKKVRKLLRSVIGDVTFDQLKIPLFIAATDAATGEEVIIDSGPVVDAVMASIAIPGIFMPVKIQGRFLIDGGIIDPVPVGILKKRGIACVCACNVIDVPYKRTRFIRKKEKPEKKKRGFSASPSLRSLQTTIEKLLNENRVSLDRFQNMISRVKSRLQKKIYRFDPDMPNVFTTLLQSFYVMEYEIAKSKMEDADIVINPSSSHVATWEFFRAAELIEEGYREAEKVLEETKLD
jgi:NTE family protein